MTLPLDTVQEMRHTSRNAAQHAKIMHDALAAEFADRPELADQLMLAWWRIMLAAVNQPYIPDLSGLINKMFRDED